MSPYSPMASTAYWLQVGVNRHDGGRSGEIICRYTWIADIAPRAIRPIRAHPSAPAHQLTRPPHTGRDLLSQPLPGGVPAARQRPDHHPIGSGEFGHDATGRMAQPP